MQTVRRPNPIPRVWRLAGGLLAILIVSSGARGEVRQRYGLPLVWHVESPGGRPVESSHADGPINPASILKVATSLWALERLGPSHRFETVFAARGTIHSEGGTLDGDLVVLGGGDPDFHVENAFLVARAIERLGVRRVTGRLIVDHGFWIGWEGGSEGRLTDADDRATRMALRLRDALDSRRWSRGTRREWAAFAERRQLDPRERPRVVVLGGVAVEDDPGTTRSLLAHRSNELVQVLKRFTAWSNNDIERLGYSLGAPEDLSRYLTDRFGVQDGAVQIETLSGLGTNRMSPRLVVRLLRELRVTCARLGLAVEDVLPVAGCDPGTLRSFPRLNEGPAARSMVGKTGTLTYTDGGITALAGYLQTGSGELVFCVAAPRASGRLGTARHAEEAWLLDRFDAHGGPRALSCGVGAWHSDADARIVPAAGRNDTVIQSSAPVPASTAPGRHSD